MPATVKGVAKTAAKRPTRSKTQPAPAPAAELEEWDGVEVVRLTTRKEKTEQRIVLFSIDGVEYSIPRRPRMNISLQFMHLTRSQGDSAAMDYLLEKLLGEDGYKALREYDDLEPADFQKITAIASQVTLGSLEVPKE